MSAELKSKVHFQSFGLKIRIQTSPEPVDSGQSLAGSEMSVMAEMCSV